MYLMRVLIYLSRGRGQILFFFSLGLTIQFGRNELNSHFLAISNCMQIGKGDHYCFGSVAIGAHAIHCLPVAFLFWSGAAGQQIWPVPPPARLPTGKTFKKIPFTKSQKKLMIQKMACDRKQQNKKKIWGVGHHRDETRFVFRVDMLLLARVKGTCSVTRAHQSTEHGR